MKQPSQSSVKSFRDSPLMAQKNSLSQLTQQQKPHITTLLPASSDPFPEIQKYDSQRQNTHGINLQSIETRDFGEGHITRISQETQSRAYSKIPSNGDHMPRGVITDSKETMNTSPTIITASGSRVLPREFGISV